ncbi:PIG-L family deacetylase [Mycolicibacterium flavescens]|uniref:GlcNAc-PI de-N-acetylase n=1 Tax=Mycolicibacterium flavescens TaxID=1776 RepID=A0A1E3RK21_MYCFV|nr:PIG-L family deacetylase [Mycolicibacterium flavescens]MCV7282578.1 PIG-L family deacetylase [Mycolicibacterium flavescens]ODQ90200.1 GlcNAc-PI de-N-acetylase [Mycolicibacterium flavescens]
MIGLAPGTVDSVALVGAHCDDIAIGAGATLLQLVRENPGIVVNVLVLTGGGTQREVEEKEALAALCGTAEVRMTVSDLPDGRLPQHWGEVKEHLGRFRAGCDPNLVIAPQRGDHHQDHRLLAELVPTEFRDHLTLGYEVLKWESDLPNPDVYLPVDRDTAALKVTVIESCYPSQAEKPWFDSDAFLGLMRVRGVQCHQYYAEAFVAEKALVRLHHS